MNQDSQLDLFLKPPPSRLNGIFIPGEVRSLKNSKKIIGLPIKGKPPCMSCGKRPTRPIMVPSDAHKRYATESKPIYLRLRSTFKEMLADCEQPYRIAFQFIRAERRKFDYTSAIDTVQDLMVEHDWLQDDNCEVIIPVVIPCVYDKDRPGVIICPIAG